jgi:putative PIN family toxin of toxin-antitoxin system
LRLVLDTNTAVSGLIWQGTPGRIIDAGLAEKVRLLSSVPLLAELEGVLQRSKHFSGGASRFRIYLTAMPLWLDA